MYEEPAEEKPKDPTEEEQPKETPPTEESTEEPPTPAPKPRVVKVRKPKLSTVVVPEIDDKFWASLLNT